ncbi:PadR family transcriptional regulator [Treponema denticola]|uniref:PadR family transcriptional regulator n=1 Tax=Treponema denticola TaxID=158 RepID=UPI0020A3EE69|nr:PadR family transcriptional regulator [Treponema denticola]
MKTSLTEELILGILAEHSAHGYNIEKIIEMRGMRKWTDIGFSSIYYVLDKLEKKGLAFSKSTRGKEKKEFSITKLGLNVLKEETKKRIEERMPSNTHFMTGLANSSILNDAETLQSLIKRKIQLEQDLVDLKENSPSLPATRLFHLSEKLILSELEWLNKEIGELKK